MAKKTIALVFGGGHVASWQAGALGAFKAARDNGYSVIAFDGGFKGANEGRFFEVEESHLFPDRAGIYYGSSRTKADTNKIKDVLSRLNNSGYNIEGIIGFCGNDHLKQTYRLQQEIGVPVVGWPKTMDNDLSGTYFTLGYHTTAVKGAEAVAHGLDGAITNGRIHLITMFGRDTDWVVAAAGGFGGADVVVGGELDSNEIYVNKYRLSHIIDIAKSRFDENKAKYGRAFTVLAVAESAAIDGLESHINLGQVDDHGHPKIEPGKLAFTLRDAFNKAGVSEVSTDTLTYNDLRNCAPTILDEDLAEEAGKLCVDTLLQGKSGYSVVTKREDKVDGVDRNVSLSIKPLPEVYHQRFLRPEGFMDYDNLRVTPEFIDYYKPILGEPVKIESRIPQLQARTV